MNLGKAYFTRLIQLLKERDMTLGKFSKVSKVSRSALRCLKTGKTKSPSIRLMVKTVRALDITLTKFLDGGEFNP